MEGSQETSFMNIQRFIKLIRMKDPEAYRFAKNRAILNTVCKELGLGWSLDRCRDIALRYSSRIGWKRNDYSSYNAARKNGWLELCCRHMTATRETWTLEKCKLEALKFRTKSKWKRNGEKSYQAAHWNGWIKKCCEHMEIRHKLWTKEDCIEDAKKFSSKTEWSRNSHGYNAARRLKCLDECCRHMKIVVIKNC
jgi:hypothetical protein